MKRLSLLSICILAMCFWTSAQVSDTGVEIEEIELSSSGSIESMPPSGSMITTNFTGTNGNPDGNMFDVTTFGNELTIEAIDMHLDANGIPFTLDVYIKTGSYVGSETNSAIGPL